MCKKIGKNYWDPSELLSKRFRLQLKLKQSDTLYSFRRRMKHGRERNATVDYLDLSWLRLGS